MQPQVRERKICPGCQKPNGARASFCADCGVKLPEQAALPTHGEPAGFWIRVAAYVIDGILLGLGVQLLQQRNPRSSRNRTAR